jgi:hypothetical protein
MQYRRDRQLVIPAPVQKQESKIQIKTWIIIVTLETFQGSYQKAFEKNPNLYFKSKVIDQAKHSARVDGSPCSEFGG